MSTYKTEDVKRREENGEIEIDLTQLFQAILGKLWMILLVGLVTAVLGILVTKIFMTPIYDSSTQIYVLNKATEGGTAVTSADLQASSQLTKDYQQLILSRTVLEQVIEEQNLDMTYGELKEKVVVNNAVDTRIITIVASDPDPKIAQDIADSVREVAATHIQNVMDTQAVNTVDPANLPTAPARPSTMKNTVIAGALGIFLAMAVVVIGFLLDDRIKTVDDVEKHLGISVLGAIPISESGETKKKVNMKRGKTIERRRGTKA